VCKSVVNPYKKNTTPCSSYELAGCSMNDRERVIRSLRVYKLDFEAFKFLCRNYDEKQAQTFRRLVLLGLNEVNKKTLESERVEALRAFSLRCEDD